MKIFSYSLLSLFFSIFIVSCTTNRSTINELYAMSEELDYCEEYSMEEWEDYFSRYEELLSDMSGRDYTQEEKNEIAAVQGKITARLTKKSIRKVESVIERIPSFINGFVDEFANEAEE